jgi:hypothetical protein
LEDHVDAEVQSLLGGSKATVEHVRADEAGLPSALNAGAYVL